MPYTWPQWVKPTQHRTTKICNQPLWLGWWTINDFLLPGSWLGTWQLSAADHYIYHWWFLENQVEQRQQWKKREKIKQSEYFNQILKIFHSRKSVRICDWQLYWLGVMEWSLLRSGCSLVSLPISHSRLRVLRPCVCYEATNTRIRVYSIAQKMLYSTLKPNV